jgi:hypothetical protein
MVNITFHTPGMFTSAIRSSQQLTVHQRLKVPANIIDQSVVRSAALPAARKLHPDSPRLPVALFDSSHSTLAVDLPNALLQEKALTSCCCFAQGFISAHVRLDKDRAQPGEEVQVILEVDNRSKQAVRKIEVGSSMLHFLVGAAGHLVGAAGHQRR